MSTVQYPSAICGHCGRRDVGTPNAGNANHDGVALCHPNEPGRPDCFRLVTVYRHPLDCRCQDRTNPAAVTRS